MAWDFLDTLQDYAGKVGSKLGEFADGAIDDAINRVRSGDSSRAANTAIPEGHVNVPTGESANGGTVQPVNPNAPAAVPAPAGLFGLPTWAVVLGGVSAAVLVTAVVIKLAD